MFMYGVIYNWAGKNLGTTQITKTGTKKTHTVLKKKKIQRYVPTKKDTRHFVLNRACDN